MTSCNSQRAFRTQALRRVVASLCVLLILLVGAAPLLHAHGGVEPADASCSLCAVAHLSALPTPVLHKPMVAEFVCSVRLAAPISAPPRFFAFSLYVRPPPVSTTHA